MNKVIQINNLSKSYKKSVVLDNISFDVDAGKIVGFIGRNGSGKTVLFKILSGLASPDEGSRIIVNGEQIGKDRDFPKNVGIIIETPGFIPYINGFKNLKYLASIKSIINDTQIKKAMQKVGLDPNDKKSRKVFFRHATTIGACSSDYGESKHSYS